MCARVWVLLLVDESVAATVVVLGIVTPPPSLWRDASFAVGLLGGGGFAHLKLSRQGGEWRGCKRLC